MDWIPFACIAALVIISGLYGIVKRAVKDALKEYFKDKEQ